MRSGVLGATLHSRNKYVLERGRLNLMGLTEKNTCQHTFPRNGQADEFAAYLESIEHKSPSSAASLSYTGTSLVVLRGRLVLLPEVCT